jgi:hypothetical protein
VTWVVLATGPSMSQAVADAVRGLRVVAVSNAYVLAPWCDALVSTDAGWWRHHPEALALPCRKFGGMPPFKAVEGVERIGASEENSGLLGIKAAVMLGAKRVLLCGFDMKGAHFFGQHKPPLRNPDRKRFDAFKRQFANYRPKGVEIINCTLGSGLDVYQKAALEDCLAESSVLAS